MVLTVLYLSIGFALLIFGADLLVRGASSLAKRFNVPEIVIGLTIVAFGTSTPEMIVNIIAALKGAADISFGNIIGSNNFNILIILGISSLIFPLEAKSNTAWKEVPFALLSAVVLLFLVNDRWLNIDSVNILTRWDGIILLILFSMFLVYVFKLMSSDFTNDSDTKIYRLFTTIGFIIVGLAGLILGGNFVVKNAVVIAQQIGISERIIGLTIVAAGTSLPELATSVVAAIKKHPDIALGNVVGSNIFNILLILGITAIINPTSYQTAFNQDLYLMIFSTVLLFVLLFVPKKHKLDRYEGAIFLLMFVAYAVFFLK